MKDAVRDGLRAVKNALDDSTKFHLHFITLSLERAKGTSMTFRNRDQQSLSIFANWRVLVDCVVAGAGAFELAVSTELYKILPTISGRARLGVKVCRHCPSCTGQHSHAKFGFLHRNPSTVTNARAASDVRFRHSRMSRHTLMQC
jgi:hypothetical protein